jgi:hypothetical protein
VAVWNEFQRISQGFKYVAGRFTEFHCGAVDKRAWDESFISLNSALPALITT